MLQRAPWSLWTSGLRLDPYSIISELKRCSTDRHSLVTGCQVNPDAEMRGIDHDS